MSKNKKNKPQFDLFSDNTADKKPVKRELEESPELKEMAERIIATQMLLIAPAKVGYILVSPYISKTNPCRVLLCSQELTHFSGFNYLIEISIDVWTALDQDLQEILLHHLLLHILPLMNERTGDYDFKLRKPDFVAFKTILNKYGTDWKDQIKLSLSSLYNLTPAQEDNCKL
ncbi:hypothetical protein MASR1M107_05330 [Ignavibacteriales bacterium]